MAFETGILIQVDSTQAKAGSEQVKAELRGIAQEARQTTQTVGQQTQATTEQIVQSSVRQSAAINSLNGKIQESTRFLGLNQIGMMELRAAGINSFQALAAGMDPFRVAMTESSQVMGAFVQGGVSLTRLINPWTIGIATLTAGVLAGAAAWHSYSSAVDASDSVLKGTGRTIGLTFGQIEDMARATAAAANVSIIGARNMALEFGRSGKIGAEQFAKLIGLAKDYQATLGGDLDDAVKQLAKDFTDPAHGADRLDTQLHFLDDRTREYIRSLTDANKQTEAQIALADKLNPALVRQQEKVGLLGRAWRAVADAASDAYNSAGAKIDEAFGNAQATPDYLARLNAAQVTQQITGQRVISVRSPAGRQPNFTAEELTAEISRVEKLVEQAQRVAEEARLNEASTTAGAAARAALPEFNKDASEQLKTYRQQLADINTELANPGAKDRAANYAQLKGAQDALTHAIDTYIPPAEKARMQDELAVKALNAKTPAERAAIAEQQKRLQLAGQVIGTTDAENQIILAGVAARQQMTVAAHDQLVAIKAETDGTLAVAAAYGKSADAVIEADAAKQAHLAKLKNQAVDEKALTDELIRQAKAERELAFAQDQRAAAQATQIAQMKASAATILDVQGQHDADLAIQRQQKLNELTNKYGDDVEKINKLMGEFDHQQALNDQGRFWDESRKLAQNYADDVKGFLLDGLTGVYNNGKSIFQNLWDAALQGAKRFAVNLALTLAEQKFILPITTQLVGSTAGFGSIATPSGGVAGAGGGGFNFLGLGQQLAGPNLFSGSGNLLDRLGSGLGFADVPSDFVGPLQLGQTQGQTLSQFLGLSQIAPYAQVALGGAAIGAGVGSLFYDLGIGKTQTGTTLGGTIGGLLGGGFLGGPIGALIGGLFGNNRPSVGPNADANAAFINGAYTYTGGAADNGGSLGPIQQLFGNVGNALDKILTQLGAGITPAIVQRSAEANITTNSGGVSATIFGGFGAPRISKGFGQDAAAAQEWLTQGILQTAARQGILSGVGDAVATAMKNSVATTLQDFLSDIDFAKTLDDTAKGLADANDQFAQIARSAKTAALDTGQQLADLRARANQLGLTGQGEAAVQSVIQSLLDFTANPEQLDATEQALAAIQGHFDGLKDSLAQFGVTADQVEAGRQKALEDLVTGFNQGNQQAIDAILNPLQAQLDAFDTLAEQRLNDAIKIGADINLVTQRNEIERQRIIEQYNQQTTQSLQDLYNRLKYGDLGGASPATTLAGTRGTFEALAAQASAGSATALAQLPDAIQAFVSASRAFNASGSAFQADVTRAEEVLQNLGHFASGGEFTVGGNGTDNNLVMFRATRGERVTVSQGGGAANDQIGRAQLTQLITLTQEVQQQGADMAAMRADIAKLASYQRRQSNR